VTVLSGRYELGPLLGTGGMGEVFEAHDRKLGRRVAVKLLLPTVADPNARARFVREVQVAAALTHPNLVTVYDVGTEGTRPFFVMEVVDGQTLAAALRDGPLPVDEATRIADGMLAGLGAAHERGLVHRDVKPGNVLLGTNGSVQLTDFGIAKATHDATTALTATGQMVGTPSYLSPEQVGGETVGPTTDVYASGVVLYEMLAGAPPFRGDSAIATALQHRQAPVPPLVERRPDVPPAIAQVVERALEKDPAARFADADTMRGALAASTRAAPGASAADTTIAHQTSVLPAAALPPGRGRDSRRNRRWVPAAVIGALIGLALVGGALVLTDGDDSQGGNPAAAVEPSTITSTSTSTSTTTTTVPTPQDLSQLAAILAGNPGGYGPRGPELLDGILEILNGEDEDGETARHLFDEVPKWTSRGELDAEVGGLTQQFLVPYLATPEDEGPGNSEGKGNGKAKGHEKAKGGD
jgi:eukaryotic-like serine/threonine-protein kinase